MEQYLPLIIHSTAGAVGGNLVGALRRNNSFGPLINTVLGALGGFGAAQGLEVGELSDGVRALVVGNSHVAGGLSGLAGGFVLALIASCFKRAS